MSHTLQRQVGRYETEHASKYLQQLCKHFGHKTEVRYDANRGEAQLSPGPASFRADPAGLTVEITGADAAALERARHVIDAHLKRFAFRDSFETMDWNPVGTPA